MPSTVAPASGVRPSDCSAERILRVGPSLTPPTLFPQAGESAFTGIASARVRSPAIPGCSRNKHLCDRWVDPFGSIVPGTDDPSAPFGSSVAARLRELIALLVPTPDAVPRRLLRPRARGPMCRELHERFMPDRVRTFKKNDRRSITFLSTALSTGTGIAKAAIFTALLVFRVEIVRKSPAEIFLVENNSN